MGPARRSPLLRLPANQAWILATAGAGALGFLVLALVGAAQWWGALAGVGILALIAGVATLLRRPPLTRPPDGSQASGETEAVQDRRFAAMLEALADPVLLVTGDDPDDPADHRFLFANAAARALLPIQRAQGLLATAIRAPEVLRAVDQALFGDGVGQAAFQTGSAQSKVWRARAQRLEAPGMGSGRLALLTLRDETEMLASVRARADFLANASHELRTPLASLSGFIETLSGHARDDSEARQRFLPIMQSQADRMRRLIENLMSLSSIEQAEHLQPSAEVDLGAAVSDVVDALGPLARAKNVRLLRNAPARAVVVGDRDQILQVTQNLAENAIKYAPAGSVVNLDLAADLDLAGAQRPARAGTASHSLLAPAPVSTGRYVALRVSDAGRGIARTSLPRLTERFYRVEGQKSGDNSGTGLGLAIVKHIINRHRGGLWVESLEGQGATFTAYFPAAPVKAKPAPAVAETGAG
jgi:two-component system phosphate regulon sensor histidine kinase PhoR